jgi:hypothetical protein
MLSARKYTDDRGTKYNLASYTHLHLHKLLFELAWNSLMNLRLHEAWEIMRACEKNSIQNRTFVRVRVVTITTATENEVAV